MNKSVSGTVMDWSSVQGGPHRPPDDFWEQLQTPLSPTPFPCP